MDPVAAVLLSNVFSVINLIGIGIVGSILNKKLDRLATAGNLANDSNLAAANNKIASLQEMISELRTPTSGGKSQAPLPIIQHQASPAPAPAPVAGMTPVPVADARTAAAAEKSANALDRLADATEKKES